MSHLIKSSSVQFSLRFSGPHLYQSVIILSIWVWVRVAPISIGHSSCQFEFKLSFGIAPISIDHLPVSLCSVRVTTTHISICHSSCHFSFQDRTYIDRSSSCQFQFLGPYLYRSIIVLSVSVFGTAPISIDHCLINSGLSFRDHTYINRSSSYQFVFSSSLGPHLYRSITVLSVWVSVFETTHISTDHLPISLYSIRVRVALISINHLPVNLCSVRVGTAPISICHSSCHFSFWDRTHIDQSSSCQFQFLGSHICRSAIFMSICVQFKLGLHLYRSVIVLLVLVLRSHLYRSVIFMSICVQFELELHLYRSVIVLSVQVWAFGTVPISIGHLPISLCSVRVWDRTYIDRSFSCQFELRSHLYRSVIVLSVWVSVFETAPISIGHLPINLCSVRVGTAPISINYSFSCQFN